MYLSFSLKISLNICYLSASQTTNQICSDCYKETIKMSTARDNMPKWNIETTTTNHDWRVGIHPVSVIFGSWSIVFSVLYNRCPICFSLPLRSAKWFCYITWASLFVVFVDQIDKQLELVNISMNRLVKQQIKLVPIVLKKRLKWARLETICPNGTLKQQRLIMTTIWSTSW
jgi:hypothetical protein